MNTHRLARTTFAGRARIVERERAAFAAVENDARRAPVLDLGIGGGRTSEPLLGLTKDYVSIDYQAAMIDTCRRKFPGVRLNTVDARDPAAPRA